MSRKRAVVTGFRPFLDVSQNPSAVLIERIAGDPDFAEAARVRLTTRLLDTVYARVRGQLADLLREPPDALVLTGYSAIATGLKIETGATTLCSPAFADATGWHPPEPRDPVMARANETVDFAGLIEALRDGEVPAALSDDAGEYVCNHAYWHALDLIAERGLATRALFVHLPAIAEMDDPPRGAATMPLVTMRRGLAVVLRRLCASDQAQPST